MAKKNSNIIGSWAFVVGLIIAVVLGLINVNQETRVWLLLALAVIGIVVGLLNISGSETQAFLTTAAIMVFVSWAGTQTLADLAEASRIMEMLVNIFSNLNVLFIPAAIVVAVKTVSSLARD